MTKFIHLRNHTEYSLSSGAIKIKDFINFLGENNIPATAITDSNVMFGVLEFSCACVEKGIQPIIGCEVVLNTSSLFDSDQDFFSRPEEIEKDFSKVVLLAQTDEGYSNLIYLNSKTYINKKKGLTPNLDVNELLNRNNGIIMLSGALDGCIEKQLLNNQQEKADKLVNVFRENFKDRFYFELERHGWNNEILIEKQIVDMAYKYNIPLVATNNCYFLSKDMYEAQDILSCIAVGKYVIQTDRERLTVEHYFKSENEMVELFRDIPEAVENSVNIAKRISTMSYKRKETLPHFPINNNISYKEKVEMLKPIFPDFQLEQEFISDDNLHPRYFLKALTDEAKEKIKQKDKISINLDEAIELIRLSYKGFDERINKKFILEKITDEEQKEKIRQEYLERMKFELSVIIQMDFPGYFLIVADFIVWSKNNGVPIGPGRGSGAGSVVAWCTKITNLDPIKYSLFFERFLNPERVSMPDFDIDLCQRGRGRTIKYVQDKYGKDMVAQIITFSKLQSRAVIKDVGRVIGMGYSEYDRISKMIPFNTKLEDALNTDDVLKKQMKDDERVENIVNISLKLEGLNRHTGVHAAGVVIGDKELIKICPLYRDDKTDMLLIQYSMKYAEKVGLVKFDFLGLKTLTIIKDAIELIKNIRDVSIDIDDVDVSDQNVFDMIKKGDSIAVFQIESSGMKSLLKQIKPDNIEDIIALISLYRPGPMGNIPSYIKRKHKEEAIEYPHEKLESILKNTYGIIVYQEQVMSIARILAGYSLGGADLLRRAMGKKIKEEMDKQREIFVVGCEKYSGIKSQKANEIFDLLAKFAEYGFNKSHATAYAIIGFQTAYLKRYYPVEFMVANMNIEIGEFEKIEENTKKKSNDKTKRISVLFRDLNNHNIELLPLDINKSSENFTIELVDVNSAIKKDDINKYFAGKELKIRYGLSALKGVGVEIGKAIVEERNKNGDFKNIFDFCERFDTKIINKKVIEVLANAGAFDKIHKNRRQIFESSAILIKHCNEYRDSEEILQGSLFGSFTEKVKFYPKLPNVDDWDNSEKSIHEFDAYGFFINGHPLDFCMNELDEKGIIFLNNMVFSEEDKTDDIEENDGILIKDKDIVKLAGVVTKTEIKKNKAKGTKYAFITISDPTDMVELQLFKKEIFEDSAQFDMLDHKFHNQLVFECQVLKNNEVDEPRFIIKQIWGIKDYLKNQSITDKKVFKSKTFKSFLDRDSIDSENKIRNKIDNISSSLKIFEKIIIYVSNINALSEIADFLNKKCRYEAEKLKTYIEIKVGDRIIQLPQEYTVDSISFNFLKNIFGIEKVEEK